jgi:gliding motility-associated-like protein
MKKITLFIFLVLLIIEFSAQYSKKPFERKVFIENNNQFVLEMPNQLNNYDYCIDNGTQVFFYNNKLVYHFIDSQSEEWKEEEIKEASKGGFKSREEEEREREKYKPIHEYITLNWIGANPNARIEVKEKDNAQYNYIRSLKKGEKPTNISCEGYKKLYVRGLYEGVDLEYYFTENTGEIKYNILVSKGVDLSIIKFKYNEESTTLLEQGNIIVETIIGELKEFAPKTYAKFSNREIKSSFKKDLDGVFSFEIENSNEELTIDPLLAVPGLGGAIPVDNGVDALGNHYVASTGFVLEKYDPVGTMLFSVDVLNATYYGDMLTSSTGDCFFNTVGFHPRGDATAVDANGNFLWDSFGITECWRFVLNECFGQVYSLTGYDHRSTGFARIDAATGALSNYTQSGGCCFDPHCGVVDNNGDVFTVASNPTTIYQWSAANTIIASYPSPIPFGYFSGYAGNQGYNGMAHLGDFLYLHNGATVVKVSKLDGSLVGSLTVPNGVKSRCGGIYVTSCGYLLIGSTDGIYLYDSNFGQVDFRGTPGAVYDLVFNEFSQNFSVCGPGHVSEVDFNLPPCIFQTNPVVVPSCNASENGGIKLNLSGGVPSYVYTWYDASGTLLPYTTDSVAGLAPGIYKVVYSDNRCPVPLVDSVEVSVGVQTLTPAFTSEDVCLGTVTTFQNNSTTSIGSITSIQWDFGDLNTSTLANPTNLYATDGSYNVKLVVEASHAYGCVDSIDANSPSLNFVLVHPLPEASFTNPIECNSSAVQFTSNSSVTSGVISEFEWDFGDGSTSSDESPQHIFPLDRFPFLNSYDVQLTVTTAEGCSDDTIISYTPHPMPLTLFSAPNACVDQPIQFTNLSNVVAPDVLNPMIYNFGDGSPLVNGDDPIHAYSASGNYQVSVIATTNNGCVKDTTINLEIYPEPVANFTSSVVCENEPYTAFTNLSTIASGALMLNNWNFGDGNTSVLPNPNHNYSSAGDYLASLTVVSDKNCQNTISLPVQVKAKPSSKFIVDSPEGCDEHCVEFTNTSLSNAGVIVNSAWSYSNGVDLIEMSPSVCFNNSSKTDDISFDVTLITQNDLGCTDTLLREDYITVYHNPVANFTPTTLEENMYESEFKMINQSIGADGYVWDLGDDSRSEVDEPIHIYSDTGVYYITLVSYTLNNCMDTTVNSIRVTPVISVFVPNTFSPNGDGVNDVFKYKGYGIKTTGFEFYIFDRWGTQLFYTDQIDIGWDGTYKGLMSQQETYLYRLICTDAFGEEHEFKGHVNLLK